MHEEVNNQVRVINYDPRYKDDFVALNWAWIDKYFKREPTDYKYLEHAEEMIVTPGGDIVFVLDGEDCVGTCALVKESDTVFELSKMAVDESRVGKGYGHILMEAVLERARELGARTVVLRSSTLMEAAIHLYKKFGFETVRLGEHPDYERANIEMSLDLDGPP